MNPKLEYPERIKSEEERLRLQLNHPWSEAELHFLASCQSTNDEAKKRMGQGPFDRLIFLSKEQKAGRGRRGRSFSSPPGGLYLTFAWAEEVFPPEPGILTILAGCAVCQALKENFEKEISLRWVNDLQMGEKKVGGILAETLLEGSDQRTGIILGIGINLKEPPEGFAPEIKDRAGALFTDLPGDFNRIRLSAAIIRAFFTLYPNRKKTGIALYRSLCQTLGKEIRYEQEGQIFQGRAIDIGDDGSLWVQSPSGERRSLSFGQVQILKGKRRCL